jgi:tight adherence protein C
LADPNSIFPKLIFLVGIFSSICGYAVSRFVLANQASKRVARIQKGLPDALDIIMMCITGGLPLGKALERVSKQIEFSHRDLAIEFEIIRRHADADTMANALRHFADRVDAPDVNALAALVTQTQRMGTHVATAICEYADSVRRAHRQRAEEHASKTSIKMLFPIILCLAPPIYILLLGPPLLRLSNFIKEEHRPGGILAPNVPGLEGIYEQDREEAAE